MRYWRFLLPGEVAQKGDSILDYVDWENTGDPWCPVDDFECGRTVGDGLHQIAYGVIRRETLKPCME